MSPQTLAYIGIGSSKSSARKSTGEKRRLQLLYIGFAVTRLARAVGQYDAASALFLPATLLCQLYFLQNCAGSAPTEVLTQPDHGS